MDGHGGGPCHQEQFRHSLRKEEGMEETNTQRDSLKGEIRVGDARSWSGLVMAKRGKIRLIISDVIDQMPLPERMHKQEKCM